MALTSHIVDDAALLAPLRDAWDELAVTTDRPFCAPGWLEPWWEHVAPPGARLHVAVALDDGALLAIAPFFRVRTRAGLVRLRPLGARTCQRVEPLARPGREAEAAQALAEALAQNGRGGRAHEITFDGIPAGSPWPERLARAWPGPRRATVTRTDSRTALTVDLRHRDFDAWFMGKRAHFRKRMRQQRKAMAARGGGFRLASPERLDADIEAFVRLHHARWADRGGSFVLTPGLGRMLAQAGARLCESGRMRVWSLDLDGEVVASGIVLQAGREIAFWLTGFDDRQASISPSRLSMLQVVEDAFSQDADRLDLGEGAYEYKERFADGEEALEWVSLIPPGAGHPLGRLGLLNRQARRLAAQHLPDTAGARLLAVMGRR